MLKKLLKQEWKASAKVLLPINLIIVGFTIIGCILLSTPLFQSKRTLPLAVFLLMFYVLSLLALCLVVSIYVLVRFYKNLFTAEGYLMFTLPATSDQLLHSKLLIGLLWTIINSLLTLFSVCALAMTGIFHAVKYGYFLDIPDIDGSIFFISATGVSPGRVSFESVLGFSIPQFALLMLCLIVAACLLGITIGYVSIVLGQLVEKHKLAAAIGFYIAIYTVTQVIISVVIVIASIPIMLEGIDDPLKINSQIYRTMCPSTIVTSVILSIMFYFITLLLMRRRINLE